MKMIGRGLLLVFLIFCGAFLSLRRFGGPLEQKVVNPAGSIVAEVRLNTFAAATDADVISVKLYPNMMHLGDTIFDASTYGGSVFVTWRDQSHLLVHIKYPNQLVIRREMKYWNGVSITYESE